MDNLEQIKIRMDEIESEVNQESKEDNDEEMHQLLLDTLLLLARLQADNEHDFIVDIVYAFKRARKVFSKHKKEVGEITTQEYTKEAKRTLYSNLTEKEKLSLCGLGLSGETGEVNDILKKYLFHRNGKPLDVEKVKDELGDCFWYIAILCDTLGFTIEDVMKANIAKLESRHTNGFTPHYQSDSSASI